MFLQTTVGHNRGPPQQTLLFRVNMAYLQNWEILNKKTKKPCLKKEKTETKMK